MPKTPSPPDPDLDELPGFAPAEPPPAASPDEELDEGLEPESPPTSAAPSTTSQSSSPEAPEPDEPRTPSPPSEISTDPEEFRDGLEYLAGGIFQVAGQLLNRMHRVRRRGQPSALWIVSEEEADAFAAPMARIAERRLPEELKTGDAADVIIAGSVAVEYAMHNAAGIPGIEMPQPQQVAPGPVPPPQPQQPPPAPAPGPTDQTPAAAAEAPPLVPPDL